MSDPLSVLLRVKVLKEQQALRAANTKRDEARRAFEETQRAKNAVQVSVATLEARQDAVYADILRRVVTIDAIDDVKSRIVKVEKDHGKLVDAESRAVHLQAEAEKERESAVARHVISVRSVDKYKLLVETQNAEEEALANLRDELEIEDQFSVRRVRLA